MSTTPNHKTQSMTGEELGQDILTALQQLRAGQGRVVWPAEAVAEFEAPPSTAMAARAAAGLTQAQFARLLGVSVRTLQEWEQGRRTPSGAARTLLAVAQRAPHVLRDIAHEPA